MQTKNQLVASIEASIRKAQKDVADIDVALERLRRGDDFAAQMPLLRVRVADLCQRIHEANAYDNALNTGGKDSL